MRRELVEKLACPDCRGALALTTRVEGPSVVDGELACAGCRRSFPVVDGIPVLLPAKASNAGEIAFRDEVSRAPDPRWASHYERHHFRRLAESRIRRRLDAVASSRPVVLDLGIGWGVNWLPFARRADVWGLDFSMESLRRLRAIYREADVPEPHLVCGSVTAPPFRNIAFDLVWSAQVLQHVSDDPEVEAAVRLVIRELLADGGWLVIDNLNFIYHRRIAALKHVLRRGLPLDGQRLRGAPVSLRYYTASDYDRMVGNFPDCHHEIEYSEILFHTDLGLRPRSRLVAKLDSVVAGMPGARHFARQVSVAVQRRRGAGAGGPTP